MFALLLAAALQSVGDIKTGSDLLAACSQKDTRVCDAYVIKSGLHLGCSPDLETPEYRDKERAQLILQLRKHRSLQTTSAEHALYQIGVCEIDD